MDTSLFKTKSEMIERHSPKINGNNQHLSKTVIALDGGYSSVKGVTPTKAFMFPSYAKKLSKELEAVTSTDNYNYQYRDNKTNTYWAVGQLAENLIDNNDVEATTDASIYGRYHYNSPMYKAQMSMGLGLALYNEENIGEIFLQTGLPATYKDRDSKKLMEALCGEYDFGIKVGNNPWVNYKFTLDEEHVFIMEQPHGTLVGSAYSSEINGKDILKSNTIILDIGFGTEDILSIRNGFNNSHQTYSDTAMKSVLEKCINDIRMDYPVDLKIFEMQKYLTSGQVSYYDMDKEDYEYVDFADYLKKANRELCDKSINRLMYEYGHLLDYKYLIVTGGTGESRYEYIKNKLAGNTGLTVLPGNIGDKSLSFSYSNVCGYYLYRHKAVSTQKK